MKNIFRTLLARQFRKPSGLLGHYAAHFMQKNNQDYYSRVIDLLRIGGDDRILEIGCGAGQALRMITDHNPACHLDGIDFSTLMLHKARKNNCQEIKAGRVKLIHGDLGECQINDAAYTKAFAINVVYFWSDLGSVFAKICRIIRPAGRFVLFMSSPERLGQVPFAVDGVFNKYSLAFVMTELSKAGFGQVSHETVERAGAATYYIVADT